MNGGYRILRIANERFGLAPAQLSDEQQQEAQRIAVYEQTLEQQVLSSQEARKVMIPEQHTNAAVARIRERYDNDDEFIAALEAEGINEQELRQSLHRELLVEAVMELVASRGVRVSETEARLYYYLNQEQFRQPQKRGVRHILITVNDDLDENNAISASDRCMNISRRLQKHPGRFAEQALKHSECPSSLNGGWLGDVPKGVLYPELEQVLFGMRPGEISDPVRSELGWHLLLCESITPECVMTAEQVLPELQSKLQQRQDRRTQRQWLALQIKDSAMADDHAVAERRKEKML